MTATPKDTWTEAKARADVLHGPNRMVRGEIVTMMLAAGFTPADAAAAVNGFTVKLRADMIVLIGKDNLNDLGRRSIALLNAAR